jgi:tRNA (mo5U34)-methyltransferase
MNGDIQSRIDAIDWYHEFDFGNGLVAKSSLDDERRRELSAFIRSWLDGIDFAGKTVLDIGCWDGYWSFYAEQRGAARVLATDDAEQNWAGDSGLRLAKELYGSTIDINTQLSVYDLTKLQTRFDIILCLGVYYHLIDPFYAFAQIRHCCHEQSIVVFEGEVRSGLPPESGIYRTGIYNFSDSNDARFRPTPILLAGLLEAAYFTIEFEAFLKRAIRAFKTEEFKTDDKTRDTKDAHNRILLICRPYQGENRCFWYRPPFGLHHYDTRWAGLRA